MDTCTISLSQCYHTSTSKHMKKLGYHSKIMKYHYDIMQYNSHGVSILKEKCQAWLRRNVTLIGIITYISTCHQMDIIDKIYLS